MNIVRKAIIVVVILSVVFGGVLVYTTMIDEEEPDEIEERDIDIDFNDEDGPVLSSPPPGIDEDEDSGELDIDADELMTYHSQELQTNSITVERSVSSLNRGDDITIHSTPEQTHIETETRLDDKTVKYSSGQYTLVKDDFPHLETQYTVQGGDIDTNEYTRASIFSMLLKELTVDDYSEYEVDDDYITNIQLTTSTEENESLASSFGFVDVDYTTANLNITSDGIITDAEIEISGNDGMTDVIDERSYNVTFDDATISEPSWSDQAEDTSTLVRADFDREYGWIVIRHDGLATMPEGTELMVTGNDEFRTIELPQDIEEDDIIYLRRVEQNWDIYVNDEPSTVQEGNLVSEYNVLAMGDNDTTYFEVLVTD